MIDLSNYPFPTYTPNKLIASIYASLIFLSFIFWFIQSIQNQFQSIRLIIIIFISHLTIFCELIVRVILGNNMKIIYILSTILYTVGHRSIIVANVICITELFSERFRLVNRGLRLMIVLSDIFMAISGFLSLLSDKIQLSFLFRQFSTSIICLLTILFYLLWFWTKTFSIMSYEIIFLLIISSFNCLIIACFLFIMSIPQYYIVINADEQWFYFFQGLPILLSLMTWSMLYPRKSFQYQNQLEINRESFKENLSYVF